ncbi:MAG TPA: hypothetical protein VG894_01335 [Bauldia sp.]|nr:hypothetical protein [Bauldia sp.]
MILRAQALLRERVQAGDLTISVAAIAGQLTAEFPDIERKIIEDGVERIAVAMGLSIAFGPVPGAS